MHERQQIRFRFCHYRGGTSKALFFKANELPDDPALRDKALLGAMGSPDPRQIDGLGGADIVTSKIAIIGVSQRPDADVDYTFGQAQLHDASVSYQGNCGNISAAVGPFAVDEGLVPVKTEGDDPRAVVRIYNTNTDKILVSRFFVHEGMASVEGDCEIPGVPGTGSPIELDFSGTAGSATGRLLPTGNPVDEVKIEGLGAIRISVVDAGNPVVFVMAGDVGARGDESKPEITANTDLLAKLEAVRSAGAEIAGIARSRKTATKESPLIPQVSFISEARDYTDYGSGRTVKKEEVSFLTRNIFNQMPVDAHTGTGSICTGAAAMIPGTLVNITATEETRKTGSVRLGHPRGVMEIKARVEEDGDGIRLARASFLRTARRLAEGYVLVRRNRLT